MRIGSISILFSCLALHTSESSLLKSMSECYLLGFDPSTLACSTCNIFREEFQNNKEMQLQFLNECLFCCQKEYDGIKSTQPGEDELYARAVLKFEPMALQIFGNVKEFIDSYTERGIEEHVNCKLSLKSHSSQNDSSATLMMMMGRRPPSPELVFYDESNNKVKTIDLSGDLWRKDVIWDMLVAYGIIPKD